MKHSNFKQRLRERAVVTAAILSLVGYEAVFAAGAMPVGGPHQNDRKTASPIKHVVVIIGENRTFDHVFATYQPRHGEYVDSLLSKGIINIDGSPGPHYAKARQFSAVDTGLYSINPGGKKAYNQIDNKLQAPGTTYAFQAFYSDFKKASVDGPGPLTDLTVATQAEYGLAPGDLGLLLTAATGLPPGSPDSRVRGHNNLPPGPYPLVCGPVAPVVSGSPVCKNGASLYDTYGGSPVHRFYQMWQQLDCSVKHATEHNPTECLSDLFPWVELTVAAGSNGKPPPTPLLRKATSQWAFIT